MGTNFRGKTIIYMHIINPESHYLFLLDEQLRTLSMFDTTGFPAFVGALDIISSVMSVHYI